MYKKIHINDFRLFQNQTLLLGKYLTVLSGRNSTGKSTILGMIANSGELKKKDGVTYFSKPFRAEFSELFKGSRQFDQIGPDRFIITLSDENGNEIDYRSFRTAWQTKDKYRKKAPIEAAKKEETAQGDNEDKAEDKKEKAPHEERFRVIPFKKFDDGKRTEAKFNYPVLYLGLSRLFPIGESQDGSISTKAISFKSEEHRTWFVEKYKSILSMQTDVQAVTNYSIGETDKKSGIGISTDYYDYLTNSSGQDNLGQILLALLSFRKLKEEQGDSWNGGILLIDEIDATLHPAAQSKLIKLLIQEAKHNQIQVVVTTHSLSFLGDICKETAYNSHKETVNNNVELYYLTNANRKLEIKRNPSFTEIESDLMIISAVQNSNKIKLYSEDAEARWFLHYLIPDYLVYIEELNIKLGCDQLINLYGADIQYFGNTLIVFDGDVTENQLSKVPKKIRDNLGNILKLPGNEPPEKVIYGYIHSLGPDHDFWSSGAQRLGFTWDYFNEHGPTSGDYQKEKDREKYKQWFLEHQYLFEGTKLMDFWIRDNQELVKKFREEFCKAHNSVAKRTMTVPIPE
jgi:AAA15 family ATPase/GTPase